MEIIRKSATITYSVELKGVPAYLPKYLSRAIRPFFAEVRFSLKSDGVLAWDVDVTGPQVKKNGEDALTSSSAEYSHWNASNPAPEFVLDIVKSLRADAIRAIEVH